MSNDTTSTTPTLRLPDTMNLVVTRDQAERLLALVDAENSMRKNHCVSYLAQGTSESHGKAVEAALDSEYLTTLRANIAHRLSNSLAR